MRTSRLCHKFSKRKVNQPLPVTSAVSWPFQTKLSKNARERIHSPSKRANGNWKVSFKRLRRRMISFLRRALALFISLTSWEEREHTTSSLIAFAIYIYKLYINYIVILAYSFGFAFFFFQRKRNVWVSHQKPKPCPAAKRRLASLTISNAYLPTYVKPLIPTPKVPQTRFILPVNSCPAKEWHH